MAGSLRLVDLVQQRIDSFLAERRADLAAVSPDLGAVSDVAVELSGGGKRFRALFCYWGWHAISARPGDDPQVADASAIGADVLGPVVTAAAALEVFHAAALVHDDLMDDSDTRRGGPSAHRRFGARRTDAGLAGNADRFGRSAALLLGDLLLGWSDELVDDALVGAPPETRRAVRREFARMRTEVAAGQYLDVLEAGSWRAHPASEQLRRAHRIVLYKSAKYSVEAPLALGASLAGADEDQLGALRGFGVPLGVAFQLRDDLLGVYGDPEVTGKPAGDDLREGKRTVLVALARESLTPSAVRVLDELLGDPELEDAQIAVLRETIRSSGAVDRVEDLIRRDVDRAVAALDGARISGSARTELVRLADAVTRRRS